jgi:uncharacterized protein (UPF0276 family)
MNNSNLPCLGVGIGYRNAFQSDLFLNQNKIGFLEIVAEHFLDANKEKIKQLELLREHFTIVPHGLNLSLGSAEGLDYSYVKKFTDLANFLESPWFSEHICFSRSGGIDIGHLSPLPFIKESAEVIARNVEQVQKYTNIPLILENITYMHTIPFSNLSESEFISLVLDKSDCGMLLDITNLYTNSVNFGYNPYEFLNNIPLNRVVQLHFVGGHWHNDLLIDSHSSSTFPEVWDLMKEVVSKANIKGIILERDDNFPTFEEIITEVEKANLIMSKYKNGIGKTTELLSTSLYK